MNSNPQAKRILCYGDSNTWGKIPGTKHERYPANVRWPGLLQQKLGTEYEIVEEGLKSRTINLDDLNPDKPGRNGLTALMPCLESHNPIDLIILMLGTNDLKAQYNRSAQEIAGSLKDLFTEIESFVQKVEVKIPQIILVTPPPVIVVPGREELYAGADEKSKELHHYYSEVALEYPHTTAVNAGEYIKSSKTDGVHWDKDAHIKLAEILEQLVRSL